MALPARFVEVKMPDEKGFGPKMLALKEGHRAFVLAFIATGGRSQQEAAEMAGYGNSKNAAHVAGSRIAHRQDVQEAIFEELKKQNRLDMLSSYMNVREIANNPQTESSVRLKANVEVLNRAGWIVAQEHHVIHEDRRTVAQIKADLQAVEQELREGNVIEGEFTEVTEDETPEESFL